MAYDWHELTRITRGEPIIIERIRMEKKGIAIEGSFELPPLAQLSADDQVFIMAFMRCDGSIKEMEKIFGISYPTVKNRLARIAEQFEFAEISPAPQYEGILDQIEQGQISATEAIERLS